MTVIVLGFLDVGVFFVLVARILSDEKNKTNLVEYRINIIIVLNLITTFYFSLFYRIMFKVVHAMKDKDCMMCSLVIYRLYEYCSGLC